MPKTKITVTEAARNFSDCINRAHYQQVTFLLLKNGLPVAQLGPATEKVCYGSDLAKVLAENNLSTEEAKAWSRDLKRARKRLKPPVNKWE